MGCENAIRQNPVLHATDAQLSQHSWLISHFICLTRNLAGTMLATIVKLSCQMLRRTRTAVDTMVGSLTGLQTCVPCAHKDFYMHV